MTQRMSITPGPESRPSITVVVSTRNRGVALVPTIASILANEGPSFALHIVDQSDNDLSERSVQQFGNDPRVHYFKTPTTGLGLARNIGIARARTELIALTDDDCEAPSTWLQELVSAFDSDERVGVVFGNVVAAKHDTARGFIPAYVRSGDCLVRKMSEKHKVEGIGACMGFRRSVWSRLRGFDEMLGAGSRFHSAEELDFAIRTLQAGHSIYETDRVFVLHNGFRTWAKGRELTYGYLYGIGAVFGKHLKCRRWSVIPLLFQLAWRWGFGEPAVQYGRRPSRKLRLSAFGSGFVDGVATPVDVKTGHYVVRGRRRPLPTESEWSAPRSPSSHRVKSK